MHAIHAIKQTSQIIQLKKLTFSGLDKHGTKATQDATNSTSTAYGHVTAAKAIAGSRKLPDRLQQHSMMHRPPSSAWL